MFIIFITHTHGVLTFLIGLRNKIMKIINEWKLNNSNDFTIEFFSIDYSKKYKEFTITFLGFAFVF